MINEDFMDNIKELVIKYLSIFPEEEKRQKEILRYLSNKDSETKWNDWNNFDGHFVAGGFIYAKQEKKLLMIYHKDLKMYLHPGGHVDINEFNVLEAAKREVFEETGIKVLESINICENKFVPFDIDTHEIEYNKRLDLPEHKHFEFRYLFILDNILDVKIDENEILEYKWIDLEELEKDSKYRNCISKLKRYTSQY